MSFHLHPPEPASGCSLDPDVRRRAAVLWALAVPLGAAAALPQIPLAISDYTDPRSAQAVQAMLSCVAEAAQLRWKIEVVPQLRLRRMIETGEAFGLAALPTSAAASVSATRALFSTHAHLVVRREDAGRQALIRNVAGTTVCVIRTDDRVLLPPFEQRYGRPGHVQPVDGSSAIALRMLMHRRCDVLLIGSWLDEAAYARRVAERSDDELTLLGPPYEHFPVVLQTAKGSDLARWTAPLDQAVAACAPRFRALLGGG